MMFKINTKSFFWIPTEDEWYKAAYYDPTLNNGSGGYWNYATRSNDAPTPVTADSLGNGSAGSAGNFANYARTANWVISEGDVYNIQGNVTSVGTNGGPSYYGTFDQSGNANEWNDSINNTGTGRGRRGGDWEDQLPSRLSASGGRRTTLLNPAVISSDLSFRICSSITYNNPNFTLVGDINNVPDSTTFGSVNYKYQIGKYEVTNDEYVEFLNSIGKNDTYSVYSTNFQPNDADNASMRRGIIRNGTSGNYSYSVKANMGNKPVNYVSWFNCARYCNWLTNGKPIGSQNVYTTEDGIYSLNGANTTEIIVKNNLSPFTINTNPDTNGTVFITESNFSNSTDGWTGEPSGGTILIPQTNLMIVVDNDVGWNWIKAPQSFINVKLAYGSSIRYRIRRLPSIPGAAPFYPSRVALVGNNFAIIANGNFPTTSFNEYEIPFVAGAFRVTSLQNPDAGLVATEQEINTVLNSLTGLYLSVDFTNALGDNDSSEWDYIRLFNKLAFRISALTNI
jgi:hypothetical protein